AGDDGGEGSCGESGDDAGRRERGDPGLSGRRSGWEETTLAAVERGAVLLGRAGQTERLSMGTGTVELQATDVYYPDLFADEDLSSVLAQGVKCSSSLLRRCWAHVIYPQVGLEASRRVDLVLGAPSP